MFYRPIIFSELGLSDLLRSTLNRFKKPARLIYYVSPIHRFKKSVRLIYYVLPRSLGVG